MILPILLTLAPLAPATVTDPAAAADHAALHPENAYLYVEVPGISALTAGYEQAPLLQMLADEGVAKSLEPFGVSADSLNLSNAIDMGLAALLGGPENTPLVQGIAALSISVTMDPGAKPSPENTGVQLVIDYKSAEIAAKAGEMAPTLLESFGSQAGSMAAMSGVGAIDVSEAKSWSKTDDTRLYVGMGTCTMDGVMARKDKGDGGLGEGLMNELGGHLGKASGKAWGSAPGLVVARGFLSTSAMTAIGSEVPASAKELMKAIEPLPGPTCFRMRLDGGRFVSDSFSATTEEAKVLGVQSVGGDWLSLIPEGVMFAYGGSMDAKKLGAMLMDVLDDAEVGEEEAAMALESLEIFGELGPNMVFYSMPVAGIGLPKAFLWAELKNNEGFQEKLAATLEGIGAAQGMTVSTRDYKVKDAASGERIPIPITTVKLPPEMETGMISVSPSFAIVDGKLLGAFSAVHIKRELKRLHGGEAVAGANPFVAAGIQLPKDARSAVMMDWGSMIDGIFGLAKAFGGLAGAMAGEGGLPFDLSQIPPSETFTKFFEPTFHYSQRVEGGLYRYHEASFGPETWGGLVALGYQVFTQVAASGMMPR